jgi:hypothetical protein
MSEDPQWLKLDNWTYLLPEPALQAAHEAGVPRAQIDT